MEIQKASGKETLAVPGKKKRKYRGSRGRGGQSKRAERSWASGTPQLVTDVPQLSQTRSIHCRFCSTDPRARVYTVNRSLVRSSNMMLVQTS